MHAWYSYDIGRGYKTWNTAAEAEADANSCFEQFRKKSSDGWCGIAMIEWGFLIAHGETQPNHDGTYTMVDVSEESPLERTRRQLEQAERERDEALQRLADRDKLDEASAQERRAEYAALREENDRLTTERDEACQERDDYLAEIERLHSRVEHIDKSHAHAARFEAQHHAAELEDALQQRNEALRALRQVLLSRDSAWKGGHDWQDALDEAASVYRRFGPKGI